MDMAIERIWGAADEVRAQAKLHGLDARGQGMTEYGLVVAAVVVIGVIVVTLFRPQMQSLWDNTVAQMDEMLGSLGIR